MTSTLPARSAYRRDDMATSLIWDNGQAAPTLTVTIDPGYKGPPRKKVPGDPNPLTPGVIGGIVAVAVLVVVCAVTAAALHRLWCKKSECKACLIFRCGRRKPQKGRVLDGRLSNLPPFPGGSFGEIPNSPEKSEFNILGRSPLDRRFRPQSEGGSTLVNQPRLHDIGGFRPQYFNTDSIVSDVALITAPHADAAAATSTIGSTSFDLAAKSEPEIVEYPPEGETHPPPAFNNSNFNRSRSRISQASILSSIITLPSFIGHDRPQPYSSSVGMQTESPVRLHHRKQSSLFEHRYGIDAVTPIPPVSEEGVDDFGGQPTPGASLTVPSQSRRKGAAPPPVTFPSPPSRPQRRFPGRLNIALGAGDEAITEWRRLPPLPPTRPPRSFRATEEDYPERLPSYYEEEPKPPPFSAWNIPLPPSPSTLASMESTLSYATHSPAEIPPYSSYPPLPPAIPSTHGSFSYPPTPHSADRFLDSYSTHTADQSVSLAINTLRRLSGDAGWSPPNMNTPTTAALSAFPGSADSSLPYYSPFGDGPGRPAHRRSTVSAFSQNSAIQEVALPSPPSSIFPSSPPPPISPRGPRPRLVSGQLKRSGTSHTQASSTEQ